MRIYMSRGEIVTIKKDGAEILLTARAADCTIEVNIVAIGVDVLDLVAPGEPDPRD